MGRASAEAIADVLRGGPLSGPTLAARLQVSQPTLSRALSGLRPNLVVAGRARATTYALRRSIADVGATVPIYEIADDGGSRHIGDLHAVWPEGFFVEGRVADCASGFFDDLPYFLHELRPAGFLGRLVPRRHPELGAPADVTHWSAAHTLRYVSRFGWDLPGAFILGEDALRRYVQHRLERTPPVPARGRAAAYARSAADVLASGDPGSSAGGEQPKFLAERLPGPVSVLVKFSPQGNDTTSRRIADLLWAEHLALETLTAHGHAAARTQILCADDRVFLEVERFDRTPQGGRRGVLSLFALDAEFVGQLRSWSSTAVALAEQGRISATARDELRFRELFASMIANSDQHGGNVSFFLQGTHVGALCPAYDMSPMAYFPVGGHVRDPAFRPPVPEPGDAVFWENACDAAMAFWRAVAAHDEISTPFRTIAKANGSKVAAAREAARWLPR